MIRKTMTMTSIAILVAALSVATTMIMVQADVNGDEVDITIVGADSSPFVDEVIDGTVEVTSFIADGGHPITLDIDPTSDEVWVVMENGATTTSTIMITIDDVQWVGEPGAIGSFECNENNGATSMAFFDKDTLMIIITPGAVDTAFDVHCEFVGFHGDVEKQLEDCDPISIKKEETTPCTFNITYDGARATIIDTISAPWENDPVEFDPDDATCAVDLPKGKNKKDNGKSATGITCPDLTSLDIDITVTTRESPATVKHDNKDDKFKPTSCGPFEVNSGAKAILLDDNGDVVLGTLDGLPIVLDETGSLFVEAIENTDLDFECED